jgi:hypothetical protein
MKQVPLVLTTVIVRYVDQLKIGTKFSEPPPDETNHASFLPSPTALTYSVLLTANP